MENKFIVLMFVLSSLIFAKTIICSEQNCPQKDNKQINIPIAGIRGGYEISYFMALYCAIFIFLKLKTYKNN